MFVKAATSGSPDYQSLDGFWSRVCCCLRCGPANGRESGGCSDPRTIVVGNHGGGRRVAAAAVSARDGRSRGGDTALVRLLPPCWALWSSGWCFPVLTGSRSCCLHSSSGCSLSINKLGTALPDRCETANPSLA